MRCFISVFEMVIVAIQRGYKRCCNSGLECSWLLYRNDYQVSGRSVADVVHYCSKSQQEDDYQKSDRVSQSVDPVTYKIHYVLIFMGDVYCEDLEVSCFRLLINSTCRVTMPG